MPKKESAALGKGLDALIGKDFTLDSEKSNEINESQENKVDMKDMNETIINNIMEDVKRNPRISLWSPKSAAVLRFLKKTKPEFSISSEASELIEKAVKNKYPEIWKIFE